MLSNRIFGALMHLNIANKIVKKFDDEIVFLKGMISSPDTVGSIVPTSRTTARCMARQIDLTSDLPVLELGPGTGVITRAILNQGVHPKNLYCVEYSDTFTERLVRIFPDINILNGDAFRLDDVLGDKKDQMFNTIITSMPLLNFPMANRISLINDLLDRLPNGRPIILFSYSATAPVPDDGQNFKKKSINWVFRNMPPARVWSYTRR